MSLRPPDRCCFRTRGPLLAVRDSGIAPPSSPSAPVSALSSSSLSCHSVAAAAAADSNDGNDDRGECVCYGATEDYPRYRREDYIGAYDNTVVDNNNNDDDDDDNATIASTRTCEGETADLAATSYPAYLYFNDSCNVDVASAAIDDNGVRYCSLCLPRFAAYEFDRFRLWLRDQAEQLNFHVETSSSPWPPASEPHAPPLTYRRVYEWLTHRLARCYAQHDSTHWRSLLAMYPKSAIVPEATTSSTTTTTTVSSAAIEVDNNLSPAGRPNIVIYVEPRPENEEVMTVVSGDAGDDDDDIATAARNNTSEYDDDDDANNSANGEEYDASHFTKNGRPYGTMHGDGRDDSFNITVDRSNHPSRIVGNDDDEDNVVGGGGDGYGNGGRGSRGNGGDDNHPVVALVAAGLAVLLANVGGGGGKHRYSSSSPAPWILLLVATLATTMVTITGGSPIDPPPRATVVTTVPAIVGGGLSLRTIPPANARVEIEVGVLPTSVDLTRYAIFNSASLHRAYGNCTIRFAVIGNTSPTLYVWYRANEWIARPDSPYMRKLRRASNRARELAAETPLKPPILPPSSGDLITEGTMLGEERPSDYREFEGYLVPVTDRYLQRDILASIVQSEIRRWFPHLRVQRNDRGRPRVPGARRIVVPDRRGGVFQVADYCSADGQIDATVSFASVRTPVRPNVLATATDRSLEIDSETRWRVSFADLNDRLRYRVERSFDGAARALLNASTDAMVLISLPRVVSHELGHFFGIDHYNAPGDTGSAQWRDLRKPAGAMVSTMSAGEPVRHDPTYAFDRIYRESLMEIFRIWWAYDRCARLVGPRAIYWLGREELARLHRYVPHARESILAALLALERRARLES